MCSLTQILEDLKFDELTVLELELCFLSNKWNTYLKSSLITVQPKKTLNNGSKS